MHTAMPLLSPTAAKPQELYLLGERIGYERSGAQPHDYKGDFSITLLWRW